MGELVRDSSFEGALRRVDSSRRLLDSQGGVGELSRPAAGGEDGDGDEGSSVIDLTGDDNATLARKLQRQLNAGTSTTVDLASLHAARQARRTKVKADPDAPTISADSPVLKAYDSEDRAMEALRKRGLFVETVNNANISLHLFFLPLSRARSCVCLSLVLMN